MLIVKIKSTRELGNKAFNPNCAPHFRKISNDTEEAEK